MQPTIREQLAKLLWNEPLPLGVTFEEFLDKVLNELRAMRRFMDESEPDGGVPYTNFTLTREFLEHVLSNLVTAEREKREAAK